ncbi:MAG TPA: PCMD domain-containing protein [Chitinophaga sp.]|uniref:PCMD domain-containing protein n=1 Tax=Chitinophaga sp. TaxID=1869181 RepID=UPI002CA8454E|nr:PCMD domain-containing protein [Chitinophaga sp.]HVI48558.1 PCMD domain-containing protein [Chitinophaga sp.]
MKSRKLCWVAALAGSLCGCIKDAPLNPEADIESFTIDKSNLTGDVFIDQSKGRIRLYLTRTAYDSGVVPTIKITPGATITPASGDSLKFDSAGIKKYTVISPSGVNKKTYTIELVNIGNWKFDFEKWGIDKTFPEIPFETLEGEDGSAIWSSGNLGVGLAGVSNPKEFPLRSTTDAYQGKLAAELETRPGTELSMGFMNIYLFAGSLFMGNFDLGSAFQNPLKSTQFGQPYAGEPARFTGYYKYKPGPVFQDEKGNPVAGKTDECSIYAVLYTGTSRLDATNIFTSERIIATAVLPDGSAKADWTHFDIPFTFKKSYDPNVPMMMAIVASSSKDGNYYRGAVGSRLLLDNIEIVKK